MGNAMVDDINMISNLNVRSKEMNVTIEEVIKEMKFEVIDTEDISRQYTRFKESIPAFIAHPRYGCCKIYAKKMIHRVNNLDEHKFDITWQYVAKRVDAGYDKNDGSEESDFERYFIVDAEYWVEDETYNMVLPLKHMICEIEKDEDGTYTLVILSNISDRSEPKKRKITLKVFIELVDKDIDNKEGWAMAKAAHLQSFPNDADLFDSDVVDMTKMPASAHMKSLKKKCRRYVGFRIGDSYTEEIEVVEEDEEGEEDDEEEDDDDDVDGVNDSQYVKKKTARMFFPEGLDWYKKIVDFPQTTRKGENKRLMKQYLSQSQISSSISIAHLNHQHYFGKE